MTTIQDIANTQTGLKVTVISDFICPWCYVGLEVIDRAVEAVREAESRREAA